MKNICLFFLTLVFFLSAEHAKSQNTTTDTLQNKNLISSGNFKFDYGKVHPLTADVKAILASISQILRKNSEVILEMKAAGKNSEDRKKAKEVMNAVKNYFIESEGVPENQIKTKLVRYTASLEKIIEFHDYKK